MLLLFSQGVNMQEIREVVSFRKLIDPAKKQKFNERIKGEGTIEQLRVRFYPGQGKSLRIYAYIKRKGRVLEEMITFTDGTDRFLSGDDDSLVFPIAVPVENDEEIEIHAENIDATNPYSLVVDVIVDYMGGRNRVGGMI
jgi:hypothetical protein